MPSTMAIFNTEKPPSYLNIHTSDDDSPRSPLLPRTSTATPVDLYECRPPPPPPRRRTSYWPWLLHAALLSTSLTLLLTTHYISTLPPSTSACLSQTSSYSPALSAVRYRRQKFDANNITTSPYVGPTKAVDLHWGRVNFGDQMVSAGEMSLLDKPLEGSLTVTDPRTGATGYRVGLEVFHQLHCLNMVRKATYPDYTDAYAHGDFGVPRDELRGHLDHCVEMLRMNLMCRADVGVITFHDLSGEKGEGRWWPDFSSWHVCRDYEAIRDWAVERVVATDPV